MVTELLDETKDKMEKAIKIIKDELMHIRTGRASVALLDELKINYYGVLTPLKQLASISIPEYNLVIINPWDKKCISEIEKAIWKSDLGLSPVNDGNVIRLTIPPLSEERRKELVKLVRKETEKGKVIIRNLRREANDLFKKYEKEGTISEDEGKEYQKKVQALTDEYIEKIDKLLELKEKEIMEV